MKDTRVDDLVFDLIDAIVDHVVHFSSDEGDPLSLRAVLIASDTDEDKETEDARRDLLWELTRIAGASDFVQVKRCSRANKLAFYEALCDYHETFRTENATDLTSDEEMFGALKNSVERIDHQTAADWLEDQQDSFRDAFERVRRDARAKIAETIVRVYVPSSPPPRPPSPPIEDARTNDVVIELSPFERYLRDNAHV